MPRTVVITGASRGIGAATARLLGKRGYNVCVNYFSRADAAKAVASQIQQAGGNAAAFEADISDEHAVKDLFDFSEKALGPVTDVVNNAANMQRQSKLVDMDVARIQRTFEVNTMGTFLCCREAARRLPRGGAIVNVSSVAARTGSPGEYVDYAASKGAVDTLTKGLAVELAAQEIRVNAVRPGFIDTQMHADGGEPDRLARLAPSIPVGRGGTVDEVAAAIAWLLSEEASYITGSLLDVAGGR